MSLERPGSPRTSAGERKFRLRLNKTRHPLPRRESHVNSIHREPDFPATISSRPEPKPETSYRTSQAFDPVTSTVAPTARFQSFVKMRSKVGNCTSTSTNAKGADNNDAELAVGENDEGSAQATLEHKVEEHNGRVDASDTELAKYVSQRGGDVKIKRILIANNGMAATKAILSLRHWAYLTLGNNSSLELLAMATPEDLRANADYIRKADNFLEVPGGISRNNYGNVDLIVELALKEGVDAVWPGWGHASENPDLPRNLEAEGIRFLGPTASVMGALGDKIAANILAQSAKVPSIPWSGDGLVATIEPGGSIDRLIYEKAMINSAEGALEVARNVGYPIMLKASEGGGGKGIRISHSDEDIASSYEQVCAEVPGSPMFMMQLCSQARHLEIQIVGDAHGQAVALNGRDCSTQRRFQKIFEEGPPIIARAEVFRKMEEAARRLTQSIGYRGAGTVEFLYNAETEEFFFLELNPRLQVEHPVTEGITGVNLPATQLHVSMGIPLHNIPDIRRLYGRDPAGTDQIDFGSEPYQKINNHVLAARITAENPDEGFKPTSGSIQRIMFQSSPNVWGYFSVGANGGIHEYADSQFGHVFASGATREDSRKALVLALQDLKVRGDVRTTTEYLMQLLETREFIDNNIDTAWLDELLKRRELTSTKNAHEMVACAAIWRAFQQCRKRSDSVALGWSKGQISLQGLQKFNTFEIEITHNDIKYFFNVRRVAIDEFVLEIGSSSFEVKVREQADQSLIATIEGASHRLEGTEEPLGLRLVIDGETSFIPNQFDPSELRSEVTGKLMRYLTEDGEEIQSGKGYAEVEVMKMITRLSSHEEGTIKHRKQSGTIVNAGDLIATLDIKDPSRIKEILPFEGDFEPDGKTTRPALDAWQKYVRAKKDVYSVLDGYDLDEEEAAQRLLHTFSDPEIHALSNTKEDTRHTDGLWEEAMSVMQSILERYLEVERIFVGRATDATLIDLVRKNKTQPEKITKTVVSHCNLAKRNNMLITLLRQAPTLPQRISGYGPIGWADDHAPTPEGLKDALKELSNLRDKEYGALAFEASQILVEERTPPIETRLIDLRGLLSGESKVQFPWGDLPAGDFEALVDSPNLAVDLLPSLFTGESSAVRNAAMEVYVRRVYKAHAFLGSQVEDRPCPTEDTLSNNAAPSLVTICWSFQFNTPPLKSPVRHGIMAVLDDKTGIDNALPHALQRLEMQAGGNIAEAPREPINVVHFALCKQPEEKGIIDTLTEMLQGHAQALIDYGVKFVNVLMFTKLNLPRYHTFTQAKGFNEDLLYRGERPTIAHLLELARLSNYNLERVPTVNRDLHIYVGTCESESRRGQQKHLLLRRISHSSDVAEGGLDRILDKAVQSLDLAMLDPRASSTSSTRVYVNVLPDQVGSADETASHFNNLLSSFISRQAPSLLSLRVDEIEVKMRTRTSDGTVLPLRTMASSATGQWLKVNTYLEYLDPVTGAVRSFCMIGGDDADTCFLQPYPVSGNLETRRAIARRVGTTYIYDFLGLFEKALVSKWRDHIEASKSDGSTRTLETEAVPGKVFEASELVLEDGKLQEKNRVTGSNTIGMVAWRCTMKTTECENGRDIVLIGNDCTVASGSFGVEEDEFFAKASRYARERGVPRIYIACNAGARMGLVEQLKPLFQIAWTDPSNKSLGVEYLYLPEEVHKDLPEGTINSEVVVVNGEKRHKINDIIGPDNEPIGVENLKGSGLIAGETSRAYENTFTLSYITGRSVGIGAYICRLGQRNIQLDEGPLILTGYQALNKVLGRDVYDSQNQLGGPQVMLPNGVSHLRVGGDQEGVFEILNWLSYVPETAHSLPPLLESNDPADRDVEYFPPETPYDPRKLVTGGFNEKGDTFQRGLFDNGSFTETLAEWGKTVVTGRARLGGKPIGVIATETRTMEARIPADPADPESNENVQAQAGQVWYPDSAYKTAQALNDFNRAENLPVMILANWRGFSGGARDMSGAILKYGSMIVDALREYRHPVFIYIPPNGSLRGGAWVVLDTSINPDKIEMYADDKARGGILEPPGVCEVKYRRNDIIKTMHRTDDTLIEMDKDREENKHEIERREEKLMPLYTQVAHIFADLHDRTGRMEAKEAIREPVEWRHSRRYFNRRLERRQREHRALDLLKGKSKGLETQRAREALKEEMERRNGGERVDWEDDGQVTRMIECEWEAIEELGRWLEKQSVMQTGVDALSQLSAQGRQQVFDHFSL